MTDLNPIYPQLLSGDIINEYVTEPVLLEENET